MRCSPADRSSWLHSIVALSVPWRSGASRAVTASVGVAYSVSPEDLAEDIIRKADAAMYLAKQRGRNRVEVYGHPDEANAAA
jgi:diguanylate cyclase (GGDEF)-like protein